MSRRLAAVWFADIVGFTSLSSSDESIALDLVALFQGIARRRVAEGGGTLVKFTGDGALAYGDSAGSVIDTALAVRDEFRDASAGAGHAAQLRIGIHIGDLTIDADGDVYGDGVNVAARLQATAEPGQVAVSEDVWRVCRQRSEVGFLPLGRWHLKGKDEPVWAYEAVAGDATPAAAAVDHRPGGPSLAVLPFDVVGVNPEAEFLAAGLHNDLLTELSRIPELTVISRTSVMGYRATERPVPQIARELGVDTIVEGTVQSVGSRVRLNVQLIDARHDVHKWAEYYDREVTTDTLFSIQTELVTRIVGSVQAELLPPHGVAQAPTQDLEAYRLTVEGRMQFDLKTERSFLRAIDLFERATELDPDFALAWVGLADSLALMEDYGYGDSAELLQRAEAAAHRAMELVPDSAEVETTLGLIATSHRDGPGALRHYERAIELRPGYADAHSWRCWVSMILGHGDTAAASARRSVELNPLSAEAVSNHAFGLLITGHADEAVVQARRARALSTSFLSADFYQGLALSVLGRHAEAIDVLRPLSVLEARELTVPWAKHGPDVALAVALLATDARDRAVAVLETIDRGSSPFAWGLVKAHMGDLDEAWEAFGEVQSTSAWPGIALHNLYPELWASLSGDPRLDELRRVADRSWSVVS